MDCEYYHQPFGSVPRRAQSLCNVRCQTILFKTVFEHFFQLKWIAALLLASKSIQNSSFGANFLVNFKINKSTILLFASVLSPSSSCFSLQLAPSVSIDNTLDHSGIFEREISKLVGELVNTKYFRLQLRSVALNRVPDAIVRRFFSTSIIWQQLRTLDLSGASVDDTMMERICSTAAVLLTTLILSWVAELTDIGLSHVSSLKNLTFLDLAGSLKITDVGLESISALENVSSLDLSWCRGITDRGIEYASKLSGITALDLARCKITDLGLSQIVKCSKLTTLNLSACDISDVGLEHVSKMANLATLKLEHCTLVSDVGLQHLSDLASITSLDLTGCIVITDVGLEHVARCPRMTRLDLSSCNSITDIGLQHLTTLTKMTCLLLCCEAITEEGATRLMEALPNCEVHW